MKWFTKASDPQFEKNMKETYKDNNNVPDAIKNPIETPKDAPSSVKNMIEKAKEESKKNVSVPKPVAEEKKPTESVNTPKVEKTTVEKKETKTTEEKGNDSFTSSLDKSIETANNYGENFRNVSSKNTKGIADTNTKDNVQRLGKYLGGGILGQIADTIGIYGDMVSTAKHNLAQAYFQAAGKGGQYKDPLARDILSKKIGTMIDSVASAIKENNTVQANRGADILGKTEDELFKLYGEKYKVVEKYMGLARTEEEAKLMGDFVDKLANDPRWDDPQYKNAIIRAMNDPEDRMIIVGAFNGDPKACEDYLLTNQMLAKASTSKALDESEVIHATKDTQILKDNMSNEFQAAYNKLEKDNVRQKFDLELQNLINGARIMGANASDAEINNRVNKFCEKWKKYGVVKDEVLGTVKGVTGVVKDFIPGKE